MDEFMLTGLRLTRRGVSIDEFEQRFDCSVDDLYGKELQRFVSQGLLEWKDVSPMPPTLGRATGRSLRLTRRGRLLGNQVFMAFVR
jgi:oxygen-independent coproporphyrinogen-3 oxidase